MFWMMLGFSVLWVDSSQWNDYWWGQVAVCTLWQWKTIALHSFQDPKSGTLKNHLRSCVWHYLLSFSSLLANSLLLWVILWSKESFLCYSGFLSHALLFCPHLSLSTSSELLHYWGVSLCLCNIFLKILILNLNPLKRDERELHDSVR